MNWPPIACGVEAKRNDDWNRVMLAWAGNQEVLSWTGNQASFISLDDSCLYSTDVEHHPGQGAKTSLLLGSTSSEVTRVQANGRYIV